MPKSASAPIGVNAAAATINIKDGETTQNRQRSDINGGLQRLLGRPDRPRSIPLLLISITMNTAAHK